MKLQLLPERGEDEKCSDRAADEAIQLNTFIYPHREFLFVRPSAIINRLICVRPLHAINVKL